MERWPCTKQSRLNLLPGLVVTERDGRGTAADWSDYRPDERHDVEPRWAELCSLVPDTVGDTVGGACFDPWRPNISTARTLCTDEP